MPRAAASRFATAYPLRISAAVLEAMQHWSDDKLCSLNAQIEYVLRGALRKSGKSAPVEDGN